MPAPSHLWDPAGQEEKFTVETCRRCGVTRKYAMAGDAHIKTQFLVDGQWLRVMALPGRKVPSCAKKEPLKEAVRTVAQKAAFQPAFRIRRP